MTENQNKKLPIYRGIKLPPRTLNKLDPREYGQHVRRHAHDYKEVNREFSDDPYPVTRFYYQCRTCGAEHSVSEVG